jgi:hypothetical protein
MSACRVNTVSNSFLRWAGASKNKCNSYRIQYQLKTLTCMDWELWALLLRPLWLEIINRKFALIEDILGSSSLVINTMLEVSSNPIT